MLVSLVAGGAAAARQEAVDSVTLPRSFGKDARIVLTPQSVWRLIVDPAEQPWRPAVNSERSRGDAADLYARVGPAVVVVRTDSGHGTGFLVDVRGTVITNYHVVEQGLRHDPVRRASYAMVHLGAIAREGLMELRPEPLRAYVHKVDPALDLAALRIDRGPGPAGATPLPFLTLADAGARPGSPVIVVGHPAAGMLWTIRSGEVASVGRMPGDMVNAVMTRLSAAASRREEITNALARLPSRRVLLTTAGINPGDSGGPVVDPLGRVIAVTFAVPPSAFLAKFAYHIHLDELRAFLKVVPPTPLLVPPDPWSLGSRVALDDLDADNRPDVLLAGDEEPETFLFDLDNDSQLAAVRDVETLVDGRHWEFEAGMRSTGDQVTAFYDTDNDGRVDLILMTHEDPGQHARFTLDRAGRWTVEIGKPVRPVGGVFLKVPRLAARFDALVNALVRRARQEGAK